MYELEIYAAGLRDPSKVIELGNEVGTYPQLRYKVDSNHDLVYFEMDEPIISVDVALGIVRKIGLEPRVVGIVPPELLSGTKTQKLQM